MANSLDRRSKSHVWRAILLILAVTLGFQNCGPTLAPETTESDSLPSTSRTTSVITPGGGPANNYINGGAGSGMGSGSGAGSTGSGVLVSPDGTSTGGGTTGGTATGGTMSGGTMSGGSSTITPGSVYFLLQPRDSSVEEGSSLTLAAFATNGSASSDIRYQWYKDGQLLTGLSSSVLDIRNATQDNVGAFHVTVTDGKTSATSHIARVKVTAPRNPCPAGIYGQIPRVTPVDEFIHESTTGARFSLFRRLQLLKPLNDAYTITYECGSLSNMSEGTSVLQCRNGKLVIMVNSCRAISPG
ncbi:MAG: immunoglobulin domain-containing protein [Bdellovibrionaceae bacterium]|nr:immunoglobulin domain-containing protein [Pseudobdellovibrionaceae bacterium]